MVDEVTKVIDQHEKWPKLSYVGRPLEILNGLYIGRASCNTEVGHQVLDILDFFLFKLDHALQVESNTVRCILGHYLADALNMDLEAHVLSQDVVHHFLQVINATEWKVSPTTVLVTC